MSPLSKPLRNKGTKPYNFDFEFDEFYERTPTQRSEPHVNATTSKSINGLNMSRNSLMSTHRSFKSQTMNNSQPLFDSPQTLNSVKIGGNSLNNSAADRTSTGQRSLHTSPSRANKSTSSFELSPQVQKTKKPINLLAYSQTSSKVAEPSNFNFSHKDKSFLERLVNKQYYDPNIEFQDYFSELKAQLAEARKLKLKIQRMSFRGSIDVPHTTGCKLQFMLNLFLTSFLVKKLLIIDLDETLIHTEPLGEGQIATKNYDHIIEIDDNSNNILPTKEVSISID